MAERDKQSTVSSRGVAAVSRFRGERPGLNKMLREDLLHAIGVDGLDIPQLHRERADSAPLPFDDLASP